MKPSSTSNHQKWPGVQKSQLARTRQGSNLERKAAERNFERFRSRNHSIARPLAKISNLLTTNSCLYLWTNRGSFIVVEIFFNEPNKNRPDVHIVLKP
eukprot:scaffold10540_cov240-Chaetoceros_neogracile.AAC.2